MNDVICIDLRMFNHIKLKEICEKFNLNYDSILENKYSGFAKLWIIKESGLIIAFTTKKDSEIQQTKEFIKELSEIQPEQLKKIKKNLNIDSILDKINSTGIESLRQEERDFLKNCK